METKRELKDAAHAAFDPIWMHGYMTRTDAYIWLADQLDLLPYKAHFTRLNVEQLKLSIELSNFKLRVLRRRRIKRERLRRKSAERSLANSRRASAEYRRAYAGHYCEAD